MAHATFIEKEQDWQNEATTYWFATEINGENSEYGIRESVGQVSVIDESGREVEHVQQAELVKSVCMVTDEMRAS